MTRIRPATPEDVHGMFEAHVAAIRAFGPEAYDEREVEAWAGSDGPPDYPVEREDDHVVVAERDGGVAGFGHLAVDGDGTGGEVTAVYVHPDHARRGVGAALLAGLEGYARGAGVDGLELSASLNAVGFYERAGYERVREDRHETSEGVELDVVVMRKTL